MLIVASGLEAVNKRKLLQNNMIYSKEQNKEQNVVDGHRGLSQDMRNRIKVGEVLLTFYGTQSHIQLFLCKISISSKYWRDWISKVWCVQREANRKAGTGSWTQLRPRFLMVHPPFYFLTEVSNHDRDQFISPQRSTVPWDGGWGKDKSVPASVAKEPVICVSSSHILFLLGVRGEVFGFLLSCQCRLSCSLSGSFC